jgi:uncharacterized coiled-coil protein SlyX
MLETSQMFDADSRGGADQLQSLEKKIASLIVLTEALKQERADLLERLQVQAGTFDTLSKEVAGVKAEREKDRRRIETLIKRVGKLVPAQTG